MGAPSTTPTSSACAVGKPLDTIKGLTRFEKEVDETISLHFEEVVNKLKGPLLLRLRNSKKNFRPFVIRLLVLGTDESSAKPCIVIFCPDSVKGLVESFCRKQAAKRSYGFVANRQALFDIHVIAPSSERLMGKDSPPAVIPKQQTPPTVIPNQQTPPTVNAFSDAPTVVPIKDFSDASTMVATSSDETLESYSPAVCQLAGLFQESKVLEPLHYPALKNLGNIDFERLYCEVLESFVVELSHMTQHSDGRSAGAVLKHHHNRAFIARRVTNQLTDSSTGSLSHLKTYDDQPADEGAVDEWLRMNLPTMSQREESPHGDSTIAIVSENPSSKAISGYTKSHDSEWRASSGHGTTGDWINDNNDEYYASKDDTKEHNQAETIGDGALDGLLSYGKQRHDVVPLYMPSPMLQRYYAQQSYEHELDSDWDEDLNLSFPEISSVRSCLYQASAFQELALKLRLSALPLALRQVLETTPKSLVQLRSGSDTSASNVFKAYIEDRSKIDWDWWPLQPRVHSTADDRYRLGWEVSTAINTALFSILTVSVWRRSAMASDIYG
jgi:hypothetical protein